MDIYRRNIDYYGDNVVVALITKKNIKELLDKLKRGIDGMGFQKSVRNEFLKDFLPVNRFVEDNLL
jgi:hypothetical protein